MVIEISVDDGVYRDMQAADLLETYGFHGMFYIPVYRTDLSTKQIQELKQRGHSIGSHTLNHPQDMKLLRDDMLACETKESKVALEAIIGEPVESFCYPRGRYDDRVKKAVMDAGYTEARTVKIGHTDIPAHDPYQKPTSVHFFQRPEYGEMTLMQYATWKLQQAVRKGEHGYFHLWFHSNEVFNNGNWNKLAEFLGEMRRAELEMQV